MKSETDDKWKYFSDSMQQDNSITLNYIAVVSDYSICSMFDFLTSHLIQTVKFNKLDIFAIAILEDILKIEIILNVENLDYIWSSEITKHFFDFFDNSTTYFNEILW